jgi:DNA-binding NtrC family response regulator
MKKTQSIFVVEDDPPLNSLISQYIRNQGYSMVSSYFTGEDMLANLPGNEPVIIIQDYDLPGINGLEVIRRCKSQNPMAEFIFLSGQGSIDIAIEAMKEGAFDYIVKDSFAKENTILKIRNLIKIQTLEETRKKFRFMIFSLILTLIASWIILFVKFIYHN